MWCGEARLPDAFPSMYRIATDRNVSVCDYLQRHDGAKVWDIRFSRDVLDWEEAALMTRRG